MGAQQYRRASRAKSRQLSAGQAVIGLACCTDRRIACWKDTEQGYSLLIAALSNHP